MQTFGWIPLLLFWGESKDPVTDVLEILVLIGGISLLVVSILLFINISHDTVFWKTAESLEEKKIECQQVIDKNNKEMNNHIIKCIELSKIMLKLEEEKNG